MGEDGGVLRENLVRGHSFRLLRLPSTPRLHKCVRWERMAGLESFQPKYRLGERFRLLPYQRIADALLKLCTAEGGSVRRDSAAERHI